jgi:GNAT superfamily N-acetyltransferase
VVHWPATVGRSRASVVSVEMSTANEINRTATRDGYELSTDPDRIDVDRVYDWLSTDAYWAKGRPREIVERSFANSVLFGIYKSNEQVAFARVVTDRATFAWLCDVYVDPAERGHGLGTWLAEAARDTLAEIGVLRIILATWDAHGVYAKAGFVQVARPDRWMEIDRRNTP